MAALPFFLPRGEQQLFCMHYPHAGDSCRGAVLYAPPFGEEMNKSRRAAAMLARRLAAGGFEVLQLDLTGCGDSSGELADARWADWQADVVAAAAWLAQRSGGAPMHVVGLRLGALLALQLATAGPVPVAGIILWQPVTGGDAYLTQLLRLRLAGDMLDGAAGGAAAGGTAALRAALQAGDTLEVAGYALSPALAADLSALDAASLAPPCPVTWFELAATEGKALSPAAAKMVAAWEQQGVRAAAGVVQSPAFWTSAEIEECPALIDATCAHLGAAA